MVLDIVDHKILLQKLEYYRIRGACNDWFKSYLSHRKKFASMNGYNFDLVDCNVAHSPDILFLIYISDLYKAIKRYNVHHFADDANLFHTVTK